MRIRPLSTKELADGRKPIVRANPARKEIVITSPEEERGDNGGAPRVFTFDGAFGDEATQSSVYRDTAAPIVESVLQGFNGTVFACE